MRNGEPVFRPTALKIPPQVPLIEDGGAVGGSRWAEPAPWAATAASRARATADGVTAPLARRLPRAARARSREPAPLRPTCHKAQRLARRSSRPEHALPSGGPAPGVAGGRGDDLAGAARPESERSGATKRGAGQFVKRASETEGGHVPVTALREPTIPGHGKGRPRHPAGAAGLSVAPRKRRAVQREGWKPVRVETRPAGTGLDAKHDSPTPCSGVAPAREKALTRSSVLVTPPHTVAPSLPSSS